jgi:hypothetical protein
MTLFGQLPERVGIQAGLNFANAARTGFPEGVSFTNKVKTGIVAGAIAEWPLGSLFYLQCEPHFVQKGANVSETFYFADEEFTSTAVAKFEYVELPLTLKLRIPAPGIKPYLLTGPNLGYRLSAAVETAGQERDYRDRTRTYDFGLDIGGGVEHNLAPLVTLLIDFRFTLGMVDIIKPQSLTDATTWKSRDFKLLASILFGS